MAKKHILRNIVAGVVIKKEDKFLLVQEKQPKAYKLWNWPAGRVDEGYTIEETAIKEAKEESGFDVRIISEIDIFQETVEEPAKHLYEAAIIGGELKYPKDEIMDAKWFTFEEIKKMKDKLRGNWILDGIELLEGKSQ